MTFVPVRIVVQSELVANEALPDAGTDPRAGAVALAPLESEEHEVQHLRGLLIHHTRASRLRIGGEVSSRVADQVHELARETHSS